MTKTLMQYVLPKARPDETIKAWRKWETEAGSPQPRGPQMPFLDGLRRQHGVLPPQRVVLWEAR